MFYPTFVSRTLPISIWDYRLSETIDISVQHIIKEWSSTCLVPSMSGSLLIHVPSTSVVESDASMVDCLSL